MVKSILVLLAAFLICTGICICNKSCHETSMVPVTLLFEVYDHIGGSITNFTRDAMREDATPKEISMPVESPLNSEFILYGMDVLGSVLIGAPQLYRGVIPDRQDLGGLRDGYSIGPRAFGVESSLVGTYPSDFCWLSADDGRSCVTSVKNQFSGDKECAVCWAFASLACLESQIMLPSRGKVGDPGAVFDLSEEFLKECHPVNPGCGGSTLHVAMALLSTKGIVLEDCDPFVYKASPPCNPNNCPKKYLITGYRWVGSTEAAIKQAIYDYGPVLTSMNAKFTLNDEEPPAEFIADYDGTCVACTEVIGNNHVVSVIGWGTKPKPRCDSNEGHSTDYWIVKNSFGTGWGDKGYFYMDANPEKDAQVGNGVWRISDWEYWDETRIIHYYDDLGWNAQFGYKEPDEPTKAYGLVKFIAAQKQTIYAVSFHLPSNERCDYTVYLYDSFDGKDLGNQLTAQGGNLAAGGLNTIYLNSPQEFEAGDDIVVVVSFDYVSYGSPIATDGLGSHENGKTFMSPTGISGTWTDVGKAYEDDVAIRALGRYTSKF